jgi:hypothetical protein
MKKYTNVLRWLLIFALSCIICSGCGSSAKSSTLFSDNFESYSLNSSFPEGRWVNPGDYDDEGWIVTTDAGYPERSKVMSVGSNWGDAVAGEASWSNYKMSVLVRSTGSYNGIIARYSTPSSCYILALVSNELRLTRGIGGSILNSTAFTFDTSTYYKLVIKVNGDTIDCHVYNVNNLSDTAQFSYEDTGTAITSGKIGIYGGGTMYDNVLVTKL